MKCALIRLALPAIVVAALAFATVARADAPAIVAPGAASTDELQALTRTLQNPAARDRLIGELRALIAARAAESGATAAATTRPYPRAMGDALVELLSNRMRRVVTGAAALAGFAPWSRLSEWARRLAADSALRLEWAEGVAVVLGVFALALLAEGVCETLLRPARLRSRAGARRPTWRRVAGLAGDIALRWAPLLVFAAVGYGSLAALTNFVEPAASAATLALLEAWLVSRTVIGAAAATLTPSPGVVGVLGLDEESANYWLVWVTRLTRLAAYGYFALAFVLQAGVDPAAIELLTKLAALAFASLIVMLVLQNRATVARALLGGDRADRRRIMPRVRARVAQTWHWVAIAYILAGYALWASGAPGTFTFLMRASALSAIVIVVASLVTLGGVDLANRLLTISPDLARRLPFLQERVNRYAPVLIGAVRGAIDFVALMLLIEVWGLDPVSWLATAAGKRLLEGAGTIVLSLAISVAIWELAGVFIEVYLSRTGGDGSPVERSARMRTLLPLARRTLAIVLSGVVLLVLLSEIGLNIAPLLAGAGIAGITIGLGAQSLVKDVINGLFILAQDSVAVGDVVTVAGCTGLVEQLSIRSIRMRSLDGTVFVVPFSEIGTVRNLTKDFSYALFDIGVSYREDVDEVVEVVTALAEELRAEPDYGWRILEPIEVLGLDQFADSAVIIKARIKTRPIQQWKVLREFNRRLKRRFDELGIEIPFPHRTLYFGVDKHGEAPSARVAAEFAAATPQAPE